VTDVTTRFQRLADEIDAHGYPAAQRQHQIVAQTCAKEQIGVLAQKHQHVTVADLAELQRGGAYTQHQNAVDDQQQHDPADDGPIEAHHCPGARIRNAPRRSGRPTPTIARARPGTPDR
jgi:hypothetical protein